MIDSLDLSAQIQVHASMHVGGRAPFVRVYSNSRIHAAKWLMERGIQEY